MWGVHLKVGGGWGGAREQKLPRLSVRVSLIPVDVS